MSTESRCPTEAFYYAYGSAGSWSTYKANLRAFEKYRLVPRMFVNCSERKLDVSSPFFGL
jgi:lactate 2-monooxygenase